MAGMYCMRDLLELLLRQGAAELVIADGSAPLMRSGEKRWSIDVPELAPDETRELFRSVATEAQSQELHECGDVRFSYLFRGESRFAITARQEDGRLEIVVRNMRTNG